MKAIRVVQVTTEMALNFQISVKFLMLFIKKSLTFKMEEDGVKHVIEGDGCYI